MRFRCGLKDKESTPSQQVLIAQLLSARNLVVLDLIPMTPSCHRARNSLANGLWHGIIRISSYIPVVMHMMEHYVGLVLGMITPYSVSLPYMQTRLVAGVSRSVAQF